MKEDKKEKPMKKLKKKLTWNQRCILCMLPSMAGVFLFFVIPFLRVFYYSLIDNQFRRNFVWMNNYAELFQNEYFRIALKNSLLLILICVPLLILLALVISLLLSFVLKKLSVLRAAFIVPMLLPSAGIILLWQSLFADAPAPVPIYFVFLWKNIGICVILLTAAFTALDTSIFEAAALDGAGKGSVHRYITVPMIAPTVIFCVLLSIVNSFKIFKESYLFYGSKYPPEESYTLQYYMNNNFLKLDYQALASGAIITSVIVLVLVIAGLSLQRRYQY